MVKCKKIVMKKEEGDAENSTEDVGEDNNISEENGVEEATAKKKVSKTKAKDKKADENSVEEEVPDKLVENGEGKAEKKKTTQKTKKVTKKEAKPKIEPSRKSSRTPKPLTKEGDSEATYEVEKIIDCRVTKGLKQYLVRWKGYSRGDDTWEDEADLKNCPELLQNFKSENLGSKNKAKKRASKSPAKSPAAKKTKKVEKYYEVEDIVGLRIKSGKKEFKIRWKGYKQSEDSWEPEKHLSCQDLIDKYLKQHADEVQAEESKQPAKETKRKAKSPTKAAKGRKTKRK